MNLFDTHAHLDRFMKAGELDAVLDRALDAGVRHLAAIGGSEASNEWVMRALEQAPERLVGAVGYDRDQAEARPDLARLEAQLEEPGIRAVGEAGLDYHYHPETAPQQRRLFHRMLGLALQKKLPIIVHSRQAETDTLALLADYANDWKHASPPGVLHCFTGSPAFAEALLGIGFLISFSGMATFSRAEDIRHVATLIPEERLLLETDCPYLAPVPHRGKRNEPAFIEQVARCIAHARGVAPEALAACTTRNAHRLFQTSLLSNKNNPRHNKPAR